MTDAFDRLKTALADRYAIEREIGAGGMATVYLAKDLKHERKVAVKVLRPELAAALGALLDSISHRYPISQDRSNLGTAHGSSRLSASVGQQELARRGQARALLAPRDYPLFQELMRPKA